VTQNIPAAIALAVVGSFCFALSARVQHSAVRGQVDDNRAQQRISLAQLAQLIRDRVWWLGLGLMGVSLICQVVGLSMAPVSVVQPVGLLAFPWSVALGHKTLGPRPGRILIPTAVTVAATFAFVVMVSVHASPPADGLDMVPVIIAAGVIYAMAVVFALLGSRGRKQWRSLFWASGGALFYGLEASLVKSLLQYATTHMWWQDPIVWCTVAALVVGSVLAGLMVQHGYATGAPEVVVASMTVTSPVVAVVFGIAVLGEGSHLTWLPALWLVVLGLIAIAGVAVLAHVSQLEPQVDTAAAIED